MRSFFISLSSCTSSPLFTDRNRHLRARWTSSRRCHGRRTRHGKGEIPLLLSSQARLLDPAAAHRLVSFGADLYLASLELQLIRLARQLLRHLLSDLGLSRAETLCTPLYSLFITHDNSNVSFFHATRRQFACPFSAASRFPPCIPYSPI